MCPLDVSRVQVTQRRATFCCGYVRVSSTVGNASSSSSVVAVVSARGELEHISFVSVVTFVTIREETLFRRETLNCGTYELVLLCLRRKQYGEIQNAYNVSLHSFCIYLLIFVNNFIACIY